jgi:16S rRNA (guanine527-N7)-methyltransferase
MMGNIPSDVSRETLEDVAKFVQLVEKWTPKINLISKASLPEIWGRHIWDSWQILNYSPENSGKWLDLGSGGGFPGILVAIYSKHKQPIQTVTLMESDVRKVQFLRTAIRELGLNATVVNERIEKAAPHGADVISARALASLDILLGFVKRHLKSDGTLLVHKGSRFQEELEAARMNWHFDYKVCPSTTDSNAAILEIRAIQDVR